MPIVHNIQDAIRTGHPVVHLGVLPVQVLMYVDILSPLIGTATIQVLVGHHVQDKEGAEMDTKYASIVSVLIAAMFVPA